MPKLPGRLVPHFNAHPFLLKGFSSPLAPLVKEPEWQIFPTVVQISSIFQTCQEDCQLLHCSPAMAVPVWRQLLAWVRLPALAPGVPWAVVQSCGCCRREPAVGLRELGRELWWLAAGTFLLMCLLTFFRILWELPVNSDNWQNLSYN